MAVFLVALPAGALADLTDRRRLLLLTQSGMALTAAALGVLTLLNLITPWLLLFIIFVMGLAEVTNDPAWQAITPEVISGERHAAAVTLNSAGYNVARAVGPALGGLVIAAAERKAQARARLVAAEADRRQHMRRLRGAARTGRAR